MHLATQKDALFYFENASWKLDIFFKVKPFFPLPPVVHWSTYRLKAERSG